MKRRSVSFSATFLTGFASSVLLHAGCLAAVWFYALGSNHPLPKPKFLRGEQGVRITWVHPSRPRSAEPAEQEIRQIDDVIPQESAETKAAEPPESSVPIVEKPPSLLPSSATDPNRSSTAPPRVVTTPLPASEAKAAKSEAKAAKEEVPEDASAKAAPPEPPRDEQPVEPPEVKRPPPPEPTTTPQAAPGVRRGARLTDNLTPRYPRRCRRLGHQGTVLVECKVSAAGSVVSARIRSSSGCEKLNRSALDAIRKARFTPARLDGKPVATTVTLPVRFQLR